MKLRCLICGTVLEVVFLRTGVLVTLGTHGFFLCRAVPYTEKGRDCLPQHLLGIPAATLPCCSPNIKADTHVPILGNRASLVTTAIDSKAFLESWVDYLDLKLSFQL